jgi:hypothetical protein
MRHHRPARHPAGTIAVVHVPQPVAVSEPSCPPARLRSRWPKAVAAALGIGVAVAAFGIVGAQWSSAQRREPPRIVVAPTIVAEPASQAPFIIQVGPAEALPSNSFLRLRGFPPSVSLSEGHAIAPGSWAIPLFGLQSLKAIVPAGVSGHNEISISLVGVDGTTLAESRTALVIAARPPPEKVQPAPPQRQAAPAAVLPPPVKRAPPKPELSPEDQARAERMLAQGSKHLDQGNISAARMFFQRAAEAGLAAGALSMGGTYDPIELGRLESLGLNADRNEARKWYERARELGAPEAADRLGRLR